MNDIIAGDPAPTNPTAATRRNMTARERLQVMVRTTSGSMTVWSEPEVRDALDAYRAEVLAEAADWLAYLLQDTPEYGPWVADKIRRMASDGGESRG